jgi:hypothetical protein
MRFRFDVSAGRPFRIAIRPCSVLSVGANVTSPSPMSTSAVMPAGDSGDERDARTHLEREVPRRA